MKQVLASIFRYATLGILPILTRPVRLAKLDDVTPENVRTRTKDILAALDAVGPHMLAPHLTRLAQVLAAALAEEAKALDKGTRYARLALAALEKKASPEKAKQKDDE
jgi:hypothetical protein